MKKEKFGYQKKDIVFLVALFLFNLTIFFSDLLPYNTLLKFVSLVLMFADLIVFRGAKLKINLKYMPYMLFTVYLWANVLVGGDSNFVITFTINTLALIVLFSFHEYAKIEINMIGIMCGIHLVASFIVQIAPVGVVNNLFSQLIMTGYDMNYSWRIISGVNVGITKQPVVNAMYLVSFFAFCFAKVYTKTKRKVVYFVGMLLSLSFIFMTEKRSASIFAPFCVIIFLLVFKRKKITKKGLMTIAVMGIGAVFILRFLNMRMSIFNSLIEKTMLLFAEHDVSNGRLSLWHDAINRFCQNPILGIGVKSFYNSTGLDVHNTYIQILTETGIIGMLLFTFALGTMLKNVFSISRRIFLDKNGVIDVPLCYGIFILMFLLIYGLVGNTFIDYLPLSMFVVAIGLIDSSIRYYDKGIEVLYNDDTGGSICKKRNIIAQRQSY